MPGSFSGGGVTDTTNLVSKTIVDADSDLIVGTAPDTVGRLAVAASSIVGRGAAGSIAALDAAAAKTVLALVKGDVGLGSVDNTTDAAKPVSTATQTALDAKQPLDADLTTIAGLTATSDNFMVASASAWASRTPAQAKTSLALVKGDVGLGNVDNTTDAGKPVSTATQTALDAKLDDAQFSGLAKISVGTGTPASPGTGDLWVDTN